MNPIRVLLLQFIFFYCLVKGDALYQSSCDDSESSDNIPSIKQFHQAVDNLKAFRGRNKALDAMASNQKFSLYFESLAPVYSIPIIMGVISIVILFIQIVLICCERCCTCLKKSKEQLQQQQQSNWNGYLISLSVIFATILFAISVAGYLTNKPLPKSINYGICQSLNMTNYLVNGLVSENWWGIESFDAGLQGIKAELLATYSNYITPFASSAFLSTYSSLETQLVAMEAVLSSGTLIVQLPNPDRMNNPKSVKPDILYILGTVSLLNKTTVMGSLEWEYETKTVLQTRLLQKLQSSANVVGTTATTTLSSTMTQALSLISTFKSDIYLFQDLIQGIMEGLQKIGKIIKSVSDAVYGINISACIIGSLAVGVAIWWSLPMVRHIVYLIWIVFSITTVIGFSCTAISYTLAVGLMENCEGLAALVNTSEGFDKYINFIGATQLKTCFQSDGNMAYQFNMQTIFETILEVQSDLKNVNDSSDMFNELATSKYIYDWLNTLTQYVTYSIDGVKESANQSGFKLLDLPSNALDEINSWSNFDYQPTSSMNKQFQLGCGALSRDQIVFTLAQCTYLTPCTATAATIGTPCCIVLTDLTFDTIFIANRLSLVSLSSCSQISTYKAMYQSHYTYLSTYAINFSNIMQATVSPQLIAYQTLSNTYLASLKSLYLTVTTTFQNDISKLMTLLTDKKSGYLNVYNCSFLIAKIQSLHNSLCRSSMVRMYNVSVFLVTASCFSLFCQIAFAIAASKLLPYINKNRVQYFSISTKSNQLQTEAIDPTAFYQQIEQASLNNIGNDSTSNQGNGLQFSKIKDGLLENIQNKTFYQNNQSPTKLSLAKHPLPPPTTGQINVSRPETTKAQYIDAVMQRKYPNKLPALPPLSTTSQKQDLKNKKIEMNEQKGFMKPKPLIFKDELEEDEEEGIEVKQRKNKPNNNDQPAILKSVIR